MNWAVQNLPWLCCVWLLCGVLIAWAFSRRPNPEVEGFKPVYPPTHTQAHWPPPPKPCVRAWEFKTKPRDPVHVEEDRIREGWIRSMRHNMDLGMRIYELEMEKRDLAFRLRCAHALIHLRALRGDTDQDAQAADNGMGV